MSNTIQLKAWTLSLSNPYFYKSPVTEHKLKQLSIYNKSERSVNKKMLPFYNALSFFSTDKWFFYDLVRVFAWNAPTDLLEIVLHKFHIRLHDSVSTENSIISYYGVKKVG